MKAGHRVGGSIGITAAARIALGVARDHDDPEIRWISPIKSNLGNDRWAISYKIIEADNGGTRIDWLEHRNGLNADDLFADSANEDGPNKDLDDRLRERMEAEPTGVPFSSLMAAAKDLGGYKDRAVRASLKRLRAQKTRHSFQGSVVWLLPKVMPKSSK
jgi:hypothetical protein